MAEFKNVAKEYIRMCDSFESACKGCPISKPGSDDIYACRNRVLKNPEKYEDEIMAWATEHPEPVYPTWGEWLSKTYHMPSSRLLGQSIPADMAKKIGVEPKNGATE